MNKIAWYFSTRPTLTNTPNIDSNRRDHYTTDLHGDAHLRGIRITLNNTFTAGGKCAPIFACVFGMKSTEMPRDEIIVCRIKNVSIVQLLFLAKYYSLSTSSTSFQT